MKKVLLGGALIAAVLVPVSASARSAAQIKLAVVPLPKSALGAAGRPLPLARDSGVSSNAKEASNASGNVTAKQLTRLGRVSGYTLDYGSSFGHAAGIRQRLYAGTAAIKGLEPVLSSPHHVNLTLVPLPKHMLGSAVRSFGLAHDSGPVSNASSASHTPDASTATLKKLGRLGGYALEYGNAFTGATGLTDVRTGIDEYKTAADARKALVFWEKEDAELSRLNQPGFAVTNGPVDVPSVGETKHFAFLTSYSASNIAPVSGLDEQIADGRFILDVIVTAGTPATAEALAPKLATKLDARLRLALRGRLHGRPVKMPKLKAGPPRGGPDLSVLALRKTDLVGRATVDKAYVADPAAISDYSVYMLPAGQFDALDQEIEWYPVANEASFFADFENASALASTGTIALDLSSLGDGGQGSVTAGSSLSTGLVVFSSGKLAEFIFLGSQGSIDTADVLSVAQAAANKIDAAGLGS